MWIEQKCERYDRGNSYRRAEHQERSPSSALRRYEAEKNSGGDRDVGQYSRHQVVRYDWIEKIEREANQHEAEKLLDPAQPLAGARHAANLSSRHRKRDIWHPESEREGEEKCETENRAAASLDHQEQAQHDRADAWRGDHAHPETHQ